MKNALKLKTKIYNSISKSYGVVVARPILYGRQTYTIRWDNNKELSEGYTKGELMDKSCYKIIVESKLPAWF